jgi:hypothetical protein
MGLINTSTKIWKRDGLLVTRNGVTRKTEGFQHLWDDAIQAACVSHLEAQSIEETFPGNELKDPPDSLVDFNSRKVLI